MAGLLLGILSGIMNGSFSLPMKKTTRWSWEATWLVWSVCALLVIPWLIAITTVPDVLGIFANVPTRDIILVFTFGLLWGLGAVFFGQSIAMIGISLAFAICIGLAMALGALIPMLKDPAVFLTAAGIWTTIGISVMILGVAIFAIAGHVKDKQALSNDTAARSNTRSASRMLLGLTLATFGGIFSSALNLAFNFSETIKQAALAAGASINSAADPVWALTLLGGLTTNVIYCAVLLTRNHTWNDYRKTNTVSHWFLAAMMGIIWMSSIAIYGRAAVMMGDLGSSAGWGLYMGMVIVMSNVWGFITGEWRNAHAKPIRLMIVGLILMLLAIALIGYATTIQV